MNIPNDSGGNWRKNQLIKYIGSFPDEIGPIMRCYFKRHQMNKDDQVWWVLLYSACYCMGTATVLFESLNYKTLTKKDLQKFWKDNKHRLIFQSDRRYIKNMDQFNTIVEEFIHRSHRKPWKYMRQFITDDPCKTYENLYEEVSSWRYYGRFGTILFLYNLNKLLGVELDYDTYDWKSGKTTTAALFNAVYQDERANEFEKKATLSNTELNFLNQFLHKIIDKLKTKYPEKNWTLMGVTSDLCSYRKLFKQTRYLGYYVDRQQEELIWLQEFWPELESMWSWFWKARKNLLPKEFLGEVQGYTGIQKPLFKSWVERGEFK